MESNLQIILSMALFAFVTSVTPGPNNMMLLSSGVNFGFKRTIPHILGISLGHLVMLLAVGAGLGQLFESFPIAYQIMKFVGFGYLVYLALGVATSPAPSQVASADKKPLSFIGAALFQWVNPKAWLMAVGYFANFMPANSSPTFIFITCAMFSLINCPSVAVWALLGVKLNEYLNQDVSRRIFNWIMAGLLIISMLPVLLV
jgi:threonine/homoserine/homoserine lactone efflux protein